MIYLQNRSQTQEVGSSASRFHSLPPGMEISTGKFFFATFVTNSISMYFVDLVYADRAMLHKSLFADLRIITSWTPSKKRSRWHRKWKWKWHLLNMGEKLGCVSVVAPFHRFVDALNHWFPPESIHHFITLCLREEGTLLLFTSTP